MSSVRNKLNAVNNANAHTLTDTLINLLTLEKDTSKVLTFDSLQQKLPVDSTNSINSNKQKITSLTDSLAAISNYKPDVAFGKVREIQNAMDSLTQKIRSQQDSITNLLDESQQRIQEKITGAPAEVTNHTNKINDKLTTDVKVPGGFPAEKLNVPLDNPALPSSAISELNIPETDIEIPNTDIPSVEDPNVPIPDTKGIDLPDELNTDALKEKINLDIPESDKIQEAKEKVTAVDSKLAVAEKYEGEVAKLKDGDYSSAEKAAEQAEQKAAELSGVDKLSGETEKLTQQQEEYKAMLQKYRDKKLQQEEVLRKIKNVANDKLNKFTPAVTEVQENIAKAKKFNPAVKSAREMAKRRTNAMKGKPFYERMIPGISLQAIISRYTASTSDLNWHLNSRVESPSASVAFIASASAKTLIV
ncbi:MAG TPA: hypothetical protein VD884_05305 [Ohtaekwangia sp.]|nr:hypothetical protein [Ohtaekwangia sp.]